MGDQFRRIGKSGFALMAGKSTILVEIRLERRACRHPGAWIAMKAHQFFGEGEIRSIPRSRGEQVPMQGFVVCPCPMVGAFSDPVFLVGAQEIYRLAYE